MNFWYRSDEASEHPFNPVPSLFTLCNALCGFTAIVHAMTAQPGQVPLISLWLIGGAMLFDVLDGLAARVLKAQSMHGMNLYSLADAVSFGAAPAVIIYRLILGDGTGTGLIEGVAWFVAACYLGCELWRLAHYNTIAMQETDERIDFVGLPSPGAAALVCSMAILVPALDMDARLALVAYCAHAMLCAFLMISTVPYTHVRRCLSNSRKWVSFAFLAAVITSISIFKIWGLVGWAYLYVLYAPVLEMESRLARYAEKHATMH